MDFLQDLSEAAGKLVAVAVETDEEYCHSFNKTEQALESSVSV